ncbi:MAG TPA: enoyl-CoA hydratase [Deltaproteobacteria bacterium]|nr:enoyl-CoA hydratase [Deltaproteobacteria bacterium]
MKITLADSENRNALGGELLTQFDEALDSANADPAIRAVVVTNEGNTFCAGANLKERAGAAAPSRPSISFDALLEKIQTSATPVIGQIDGHVVGGGNGLAAAFDISVAREDVKFGFTEVRLGVVPAIISVVCLPKMNRGNAMDAFLRGNRFSATRAAAMGLINYAVPGDQLESAVDEIVSDIAKGGPNAVSVAKQLVNEVPAMDQKDAFAKMAKLSAELFSGDEAKGGMRAFLKKEKAPWASEDS